MKFLLRWLFTIVFVVIGCALILVVIIILLLWHFDRRPVAYFLEWCRETMYDIFGWHNIKKRLKEERKKVDNYNDWKAWTVGDVKWWVICDGDDRIGEATNILRYISINGLYGITDSDSYGVTRVTIHQIAEKLRMAGYGKEADELLAQQPLESGNSIFTKPPIYK